MEATAGCKYGTWLDLSVLWLVLGMTPTSCWALFLCERSRAAAFCLSIPFCMWTGRCST